MFYSEHVLAKKGPLGRIWLAAHWEKKLSKNHTLQTDIPSAVGMSPPCIPSPASCQTVKIPFWGLPLNSPREAA